MWLEENDFAASGALISGEILRDIRAEYLVPNVSPILEGSNHRL